MAKDDRKRSRQNKERVVVTFARAVINAEESGRAGYQPEGDDFDPSQAFEPQPTVASAPSTLTPEALGEDTPVSVDPGEANAGAES
jgi:hypothetical protein